MLVDATTGDELLALIGMPADAARVQMALARLARGMQPELGHGDDSALVDWVTVNEIGLEFGFEDEAYVRALASTKRRQGPVLLSQLYFYGDTPKTEPFPYALPFQLDFGDDRATVRAKLSGHDGKLRPYTRDAWQLPLFNVTAAYRAENGLLESVLCYVPYTPWPTTPDEIELLAPFTPDEFCRLFGARWSSARLRSALDPLGYAGALPDARSEHNADLRMSHGIEFGFAPGHQVPVSDPEFPHALTLATVTYYGPRVYDAVAWTGPMPFGFTFQDSQVEIVARIGRKPDERADFDRVGFVLWHLDRLSLRAEFSNIENRLLRLTLMTPGYWHATMKDGVGSDGG